MKKLWLETCRSLPWFQILAKPPIAGFQRDAELPSRRDENFLEVSTNPIMGLESSRTKPAFERTQCRAGAIRVLHTSQLSQLAAARSHSAKVRGSILVIYTKSRQLISRSSQVHWRCRTAEQSDSRSDTIKRKRLLKLWQSGKCYFSNSQILTQPSAEKTWQYQQRGHMWKCTSSLESGASKRALHRISRRHWTQNSIIYSPSTLCETQ